jgi:hypothetical protein
VREIQKKITRSEKTDRRSTVPDKDTVIDVDF